MRVSGFFHRSVDPDAIGLAAMVPLLGVALPWIRLSVIGSVQYELFAADAATPSPGTVSAAGRSGPAAFNTAAWIMTLSIMSGPHLLYFFPQEVRKWSR